MGIVRTVIGYALLVSNDENTSIAQANINEEPIYEKMILFVEMKSKSINVVEEKILTVEGEYQ